MAKYSVKQKTKIGLLQCSIIILAAVFLFPGLVRAQSFAWGQKFDCDRLYVDLKLHEYYKSKKTFAVGVHDQRPYVLDNEKLPTYVGTVRNTFGIPFDVTTKSDRPLSDEIAAAIVRGFKAYYIVNVASMEIPLLDDHQSALEKLKKTGNQILILLTLREWRNWTSYTTAGLNIDAVLQVFDGQGKKLASSNIQMIDQYNSPLNASTYLTALINEPSVKAVLFPKFKPLKMEDGVEVPPDKAMED